MIEGERDCVDIAHQITAVVPALRRVQGDMVRDHLAALVEAAATNRLSEVERLKPADEIRALLTRTG